MSAMVNEEMLASLPRRLRPSRGWPIPLRPLEAPRPALRRALAAGVAAGLALLTKLSGLLTALACAAGYALDARRRRDALARGALCCVVAAAVGGWFYARNRIEYGYFQPHDLAAHRMMFGMPPGERALADYLRFPLATFTDPQVLNPSLLHSVWGTTYAIALVRRASLLPADALGQACAGSASVTLVLALLPTAAFLAGPGGGRAAARARRRRRRRAASRAGRALARGLRALHLAEPVVRGGEGHEPARPVRALRGLHERGAVPLDAARTHLRVRSSASRSACSRCTWSLGPRFNGVFVRTEYPGIPWNARGPS